MMLWNFSKDIIILLILLFSLAGNVMAESKKTLKAFPVKNFKSITIDTEKSNIKITKKPSSPFTQVQYTKRNFNEDHCELIIENKDGRFLSIQSKRKNPLFSSQISCEVDFDITVPNNPAVSVKGGQTSLETNDVNAHIQMDVGQGSLRVTNPTQIKLSGGQVSVKATDVQGDCVLDGGTLDIDLIYKSLVPNQRFIKVSSGSLRGKLTVPLGSQVHNKIKSASPMSHTIDRGVSNFVLEGSAGLAQLLISTASTSEPAIDTEQEDESLYFVPEKQEPVLLEESVAQDALFDSRAATEEIIVMDLPTRASVEPSIEEPKGLNSENAVIEILGPVLSAPL